MTDDPTSGPGPTDIEADDSAVGNDATLSGATLAGRFSIERLLGEGGMGRVYAGRQLSVNRPVALKVIRQDVSGSNEVRARFMREAKVVSSFSHPNIVRIFDFGESDGHLFIAMEYVDGEPLTEVVPPRGLPVAIALEIMDQVTGALVEAHDAGIVHRDIKPDNIMITCPPDGRMQARVLDFGIAHIEQKSHLLEDDATSLTRQGAVYGTPEYMAPEQVRGRTVGPFTDSYALGIVLYELITGSCPFQSGSPMHTMFMHVRDEPDLTAGPLSNIPELSSFLADLLAKEPEDRPQHARALVRRLRRVKSSLDLPRVPPLPELPLREAFAQITEALREEEPEPEEPTVDDEPSIPKAFQPEPDPPASLDHPGRSRRVTPVAPGLEMAGSGPSAESTESLVAAADDSGSRTAETPPEDARERQRQLIVWAFGLAGLTIAVFAAVLLAVMLKRQDNVDGTAADESVVETEVATPDPPTSVSGTEHGEGTAEAPEPTRDGEAAPEAVVAARETADESANPQPAANSESTKPSPTETAKPKETAGTVEPAKPVGTAKTAAPEETTPKETKPKETKPKETKPKETKPKETKPKETKPKETKPKETKPKETKPTEKIAEDEKPPSVAKKSDSEAQDETTEKSEDEPEAVDERLDEVVDWLDDG